MSQLASRLWFATIPKLRRQLPAEGHQANMDEESLLAILHDGVTSKTISRLLAKATSIPMQDSLKGGRDKLDDMKDSLAARVVGQDHIVFKFMDAVRIVRAGSKAHNHPGGLFLSLGPTGITKMERRKALVAPLLANQFDLMRENKSLPPDEYANLIVLTTMPRLCSSRLFHFWITLRGICVETLSEESGHQNIEQTV